MSQKQSAEATAGSFRTDTMLFGLLLSGVILIVGVLTYFPALALGPIIEHLLMNAGRLF
jgi:potassium-transporting ATPase potassium-binding subunit